jgi:hypothetical protein
MINKKVEPGAEVLVGGHRARVRKLHHSSE